MHLDHMQIFAFSFETVVSGCSPERPGTHRNPPASECQVRGLQACAIIPTSMQILDFATH